LLQKDPLKVITLSGVQHLTSFNAGTLAELVPYQLEIFKSKLKIRY